MRPFYFLQLFGNSYILSRRKIRKRKCFLFFFFENRGIKEYFSSSLKRVFTKLPKNSSILANQKNNNMREKICFFLLPSENRRRKFVQLIEGTFVSKKEIFSSSLQRVFIKLPKNSSILANQKNNNL